MTPPPGNDTIRWHDGTILKLGGPYRAREVAGEWIVIGQNKIFPIGDHEEAEGDAERMAHELNNPKPQVPIRKEPELHLSSVKVSETGEEVQVSIQGTPKKGGEIEELVNLIMTKKDAEGLLFELQRVLWGKP